ncbi:MAG: hypothetical protein WD097_02560 [Balneolales bacterium]
MSHSAYSQHKEYQGSDNKYLAIEKPEEDVPALLLITGNAAERPFSIAAYDENGNRTGTLVNTSDSYSGIVALDLPTGRNSRYLELEVSGPWLIRVHPIGSAPKISPGEEFSDAGDNVLWVDGDASRATIHADNRSSENFTIRAFDEFGNYNGLLVHTTSSYSGEEMIPDHTLLLVVKAMGSWSITLE